MRKGNIVRVVRATRAHGYAPKEHSSAWIWCDTPIGEGLQGVIVRCAAAGRTAVKDGRAARPALAWVDFGTRADGVSQVIAVAKADLAVMIDHAHAWIEGAAPVEGREDDYPDVQRIVMVCSCGAVRQ